MALTKLEADVLKAIAYHEYNSGNGARPTSHRDVNTWSWADDFARDIGGGVSKHSVKGAMGTLTQKGLLWTSGKGKEAGVGFTEAGFKAFTEAWPE